MKIKLLTSRVLSTRQTQDFGDIIDVPDDEGENLIKHGQAIKVGQAPELRPTDSPAPDIRSNDKKPPRR